MRAYARRGDFIYDSSHAATALTTRNDGKVRIHDVSFDGFRWGLNATAEVTGKCDFTNVTKPVYAKGPVSLDNARVTTHGYCSTVLEDGSTDGSITWSYRSGISSEYCAVVPFRCALGGSMHLNAGNTAMPPDTDLGYTISVNMLNLDSNLSNSADGNQGLSTMLASSGYTAPQSAAEMRENVLSCIYRLCGRSSDEILTTSTAVADDWYTGASRGTIGPGTLTFEVPTAEQQLKTTNNWLGLPQMASS